LQLKINNIKAIVWDWNGTLLNDIDICIKCINQLLSKRNKKTLTKEIYTDIFTFPVKDYYQLAGFDFEEEEFEKPAMEFINLYHENLPNSGLHKSVITILNIIKNKNIPQYILSAMEHESLVKSLKYTGIYDYFVDIKGIDNHYAHSKLEMGIDLLKRIDIKKSEILLIGDTLHDKRVANDLGINYLLVAEGHQSKERLLKNTPMVVDNLEEVCQLFN